MPAAVWSDSTVQLGSIHVSCCLISCLCPLYMLLCSYCCVSETSMSVFKHVGWMRKTDQQGEAAHACRAQSIAVVLCMQSIAVGLSLALTPVHGMTADLARRHYAHHLTYSSQMASMTLSQPVGQQSTSLKPSQLQSMVRGYPNDFPEACCLWHFCLVPDAHYACNRSVQAVNMSCSQCTSICILQTMEVVWHTAHTANKARCCLIYCTHAQQYADLRVPAEGPHAFDVESTKPEDPASAAQARAQGLQYIQTWVNQYNAQKASIPMSNPSDLFNLAFDVGGYASAWNNTLPGSNTNYTHANLSGTAAIYSSSV